MLGEAWDWKKKEKGDLSETVSVLFGLLQQTLILFNLKKSNKIIKSYRHEQTFLLEEISLDEE